MCVSVFAHIAPGDFTKSIPKTGMVMGWIEDGHLDSRVWLQQGLIGDSCWLP